MKWQGKALGGVIGAAVGGPLGAGIGAALGHLLADTEDELKLVRVSYQDFLIGEEGPGLLVKPAWEVQAAEGQLVRVEVELAGGVLVEEVELEEGDRLCTVPVFFIPYHWLEQKSLIRLSFQLGSHRISEKIQLSLPSPLKQLSAHAPGRAVMALFAGGASSEFVWAALAEIWVFNMEGKRWFTRWWQELERLDSARLSPEKVALRVGTSLSEPEMELLVDWLAALQESSQGNSGWISRFYQELAHKPELLPQSIVRAKLVLEVPLDASVEACKTAWRAAVLAVHPDRNPSPDATQAMARLNAAWERIRNQDRSGGGSVRRTS